MESISAFEIIKVGIGPSSSHTMGPWRAAERFINVLKLKNHYDKVTEITTFLYGSLAKTGIGHGSDIAVMLGLSGENFQTIDTDTIPEKIEEIKTSGKIKFNNDKSLPFEYDKNIKFEYDTTLDFHPNGMRIVAHLEDGNLFDVCYYSIGGGFVVREGQDDEDIMNHSENTPYPCHSAKDILDNCKKLNIKVSELVFKNEQTWRTKKEIKSHALYIWEEIKQCVFRGVSKRGILPGGLNVRRRAFELSKKRFNNQKFNNVDEWIDAIKSGPKDFNTVNKWVSIFALAVNEENASFGRIITAPTNGASGVLPAVLLYAYCFTPHFDEDKIVDFILTAGEIGTLWALADFGPFVTPRTSESRTRMPSGWICSHRRASSSPRRIPVQKAASSTG